MKIATVVPFLILRLLPLAAAQDPGQDITCSATKECAIGCCGTFGICGMGPDFCGSGNCINNCDRKSECDPANWGPTYAANEGCPLNVCCSKYGFCGTTEEFCGDNVVKNPTCSGISATQRTIGYYEGWGITRPCGAIYPEDLNIGAYTHLNFAFAFVDPDTFAVAPMLESDKKLYSRLTNLKTMKPGLQVWISIGGWSMNDPGATQTTFSDLAASAANQQRFFASLISFMTTYGFDGVDIDWEYPGADDRGGRPEDVQNFPALLRNMRSAFAAAGHNFGISVTFPSSFWYMQHFDVVAIQNAVDWINMMTYDIHGTWDAINQWEGPYVKPHSDITEIDQGLKLLWRNDIDPAKVVLGIGFYGRSFKLKDSSCTAVGCEFTAGGDAGPCTQSEGTLGYAEIMNIIANGAVPTLNSTAGVQVLVYDTDNWVSYDDAVTIKIKMEYANQNCLGGTMVWAASLDDKAGSAASALSESTGLLTNFRIGSIVSDNVGSCVWTACGQQCPAGYTTAQSTWPANPLGCPGPANNKFVERLFCCPITDVPTCTWRLEEGTGGDTPCKGDCQSGEIAVASTYQLFGLAGENLCQQGGQLSMCCKGSKSLSVWDKCTWAGTPPLCGLFSDDAAACPSDKPVKLTDTLRADGGAQVCTRGYRSLCCEDPAPVQNCQWYRNAFHNICTPGCPAGKIEMAVDNEEPRCASGYGSLCCDLVPGANGSPTVQAFASLVQRWITSGVCDLQTGLGLDSLVARSITSTPARLLQERADGTVTDSEMAYWLYPLLSPGRVLSAEQSEELDVWNDSMQQAGGSYQYLTSSNLEYVVSDSPDGVDLGIDPTDPLTELFCCLDDCIDGMLGEIAVSSTDVCEIVTEEETPVDVGVWKRTFNEFDWYNGAGPFQQNILPGVGQLIQAVIDNRVRLEYFSFFRYGQGTADSTDFELEIVYFLGTDPNNMVSELMGSGTNSGPFAVFHLHFSGGYANGAGTTGIGITSINVSHGTRITRRGNAALRNTPDGAWTINRSAQRSIFRCPQDMRPQQGTIRAYRFLSPPMRQALGRNTNVGPLIGRFVDLINRYSPTQPGILQGQTGATLVRNWGVPVQPQRHVIDQANTRWQRQPQTAANPNPGWERSTSAMGQGFVLYDPRVAHNGDLWGVYAFQN